MFTYVGIVSEINANIKTGVGLPCCQKRKLADANLLDAPRSRPPRSSNDERGRNRLRGRARQQRGEREREGVVNVLRRSVQARPGGCRAGPFRSSGVNCGSRPSPLPVTGLAAKRRTADLQPARSNTPSANKCDGSSDDGSAVYQSRAQSISAHIGSRTYRRRFLYPHKEAQSLRRGRPWPRLRWVASRAAPRSQPHFWSYHIPDRDSHT